MNTYLAWNNALGDYYFNPQRASKTVTLYVDRKRIDEIGRANGLGGWGEFILAAGSRVFIGGHPNFGQASPLRMADLLLDVWFDKEGLVDKYNFSQLSHPPVWIGFALLVLAWTETDLLQERSYYDRLAHFLKATFPHHSHETRPQLGPVVAHFAEALPKLAQWLPMRLGPEAPRLLTGQLGQHRYVGAIRYHALLSPEERLHLPQIWKELRLEAATSITARRLLELVRQSHQVETYMPALQRSLTRLNEEGLDLLGNLLLGELQAWDGQHATTPAKSINLNRSPRIRIRWEGIEPDGVYLEWARSLEPLHCEGKIYHAIRVPGSTHFRLHDAETGDPLIPDLEWLFGEIELSNAEICAKRPARHHAWFHPASTLGQLHNGYLEVSKPIPGAPFKLLTDGTENRLVEEFPNLTQPREALRCKEILLGCWRFTGPAMGGNPFSKERESTPQTRIMLSSRGKVREGHFIAETELVAEIDPPLAGGFLYAHTLGTQALQVQPMEDGRYRLALPIDAPNGQHVLVLKDAAGHAVREARIHMAWREPIRAQDLDLTEGYDPQGNWRSLADAVAGDPPLFLHNQFIGGQPEVPVVPAIHVTIEQGERPRPRTHPDLGTQLLAHARRDGSMSMDTFKAVVQEIAAARDRAPLENQDLHEVRRKMSALGFLHYNYETREIQLSPLTIALLPFDQRNIRALLLGPVPQSVANWLGNWQSPGHHPVKLFWRHPEAELLPPLLEIHTNSIEALEHLRQDLNAYFPEAVAPFRPEAIAESLLAWIAPIPAAPRIGGEDQHQWSSFPEHEERWDARLCAFARTGEQPHFPLLTRAKQRFGGAWDCVLWQTDARGFIVGHHTAVPYLHHLAHLPYIGQNAAKTDEILLAGRHRQSDLLERALVLATGRLPHQVPASHIPQWSHLFHPDAVFRKFTGIRPQMRKQLTRIFQQVLHLDPSHPFPQVHIHPPKTV